MSPSPPAVTIIGGGLAGCEAAWQLAERGRSVVLYEMRPVRRTPAHQGDRLAELVCSNSMGSLLQDRALGILKRELLLLGSLLVRTACAHSLPGGAALTIDREAFAAEITSRIGRHPLIDLRRDEVCAIPEGPTIIATGPLTSQALTKSIQALTGERKLHFFDAVAPIVYRDSIDMSVAFRQNRWQKAEDGTPEGDYINCPMNADRYAAFVDAVRSAESNALSKTDADLERYFEGCLPIEVLARRGEDALAFGPMRPVGLRDPRTGHRPHAVVQLRQDNAAASLYNLVGFQTNIKWGRQEEILRLIPGLERGRFARMGQMHRNTFISSPDLLLPTMQSRIRDNLFFAGQITGTEGYVGSTMGGLVCGLNMDRMLDNRSPWTFPAETMVGALLRYITHTDARHFQPMKANMGLLPELPVRVRRKRERYQAFSERARQALSDFMQAGRFTPLDLDAADLDLVTRLTRMPEPMPETAAAG